MCACARSFYELITYQLQKWLTCKLVWAIRKATLTIAPLQSAIHVMIEFPLIIGETNFLEVPIFMKSMKFVAYKKVSYMV